VQRRLVPPALVVVAVLCGLAGAAGLAHLVLLAAVPVSAVTVLDAVTERVAARAGRVEVALAIGALAFVVGAAAARAPLLGIGCVLLSALRPLSAVRPMPRPRRQPATDRL
jgi:hypothetical protein